MAPNFPALQAVQEELAQLLAEADDGQGGSDVAKIRSITGSNAEKLKHIKTLSARVRELKATNAAMNAAGELSGDGAQAFKTGVQGSHKARTADSSADVADWAAHWAKRLSEAHSNAGTSGVKALTTASPSVDAPGMVRTGLYTKPVNPFRLLDLVVDRRSVPGNEFEYLTQTVRTNNAAATVDNATKPTSIFTVKSVQDRARVYAHLSETVPLRILADHKDLSGFLQSEMDRGVLDALEADIVSGASGAVENVTGIVNTTGINAQAYSTSVPQTLRKALTAAQTAHVAVNAWVIHPDDAEILDLLLTADGEYVGSSADGQFAYSNIFGDVPRLITTSVPSGTALLGDWSQCTLYVRQDVTLDVDVAGTLFDKNQAKFRAEGRFGFAVNRPDAFWTVDLTA